MYALLEKVANLVLGWPLIIYVAVASIVCTIACGFVQFRYFFKAWKFTFFPEKPVRIKKKSKVDMTPFQAFTGALNTALGSGAIAGVATAIFAGGPGSVFWLVATIFFVSAIRYCEVFLSAYFGARITEKTTAGGPMLYLKSVVGGKYLTWLFAFFALFYGLLAGCSVQTNTAALSIATTWGVPYWLIAAVMFLFVLYVLLGGAPRIVKASDFIIPVKVLVFFVSVFIILVFHYQNLLPALKLIVTSAFSSKALAGGVTGFAVQEAIRYGMARCIFATSSGVGSTAILFSATGSQQPVRSGIMSMVAAIISTIACFLIGWCIIASGVWASGADSTALTIASYETVFGWFGGWIVSFLSVAFTMGVLVVFAYITREAWLFLTGGRFAWVHLILYPSVALWGVLANVRVVWAVMDLSMAGMLFINLFGILYLLPLIKKELRRFAGEAN